MKHYWISITIIVEVLFSGCTNPRTLSMDIEKIANAKLVINRAQDSYAEKLAPFELHSAIRKLRQARKAISEREYDDAAHLAEQALMDAALAEAKAELEMARLMVNKLYKDIEKSNPNSLNPIDKK
jgi:hypothetical protein